MILYLLTVSCQQKQNYISESNLRDVLLWLKMSIQSFKVYNYSYERSGYYHQLHFHGIIAVSNRFRWKPYTQYGDVEHCENTFRIQWSRIHDYEGAVSYVYKDTHNCSVKQDQIFNENIYQHHYFNIDLQTFRRLESRYAAKLPSVVRSTEVQRSGTSSLSISFTKYLVQQTKEPKVQCV